MSRGLAMVAVIALLAVTVLLLAWMDSRSKRRKADWRDLAHRAETAEEALRKIRKEMLAAHQSGMSLDSPMVNIILNDYDLAREAVPGSKKGISTK